MDGIKIEIPGVEVVGTLNVNALFQTLAAIHSRKHGLEILFLLMQPGDYRHSNPSQPGRADHGESQRVIVSKLDTL